MLREGSIGQERANYLVDELHPHSTAYDVMSSAHEVLSPVNDFMSCRCDVMGFAHVVMSIVDLHMIKTLRR